MSISHLSLPFSSPRRPTFWKVTQSSFNFPLALMESDAQRRWGGYLLPRCRWSQPQDLDEMNHVSIRRAQYFWHLLFWDYEHWILVWTIPSEWSWWLGLSHVIYIGSSDTQRRQGHKYSSCVAQIWEEKTSSTKHWTVLDANLNDCVLSANPKGVRLRQMVTGLGSIDPISLFVFARDEMGLRKTCLRWVGATSGGH